MARDWTISLSAAPPRELWDPVAPIPVMEWEDGSVLYRVWGGSSDQAGPVPTIRFELCWDRTSPRIFSSEIRHGTGSFTSRCFRGLLGSDGWPVGAFHSDGARTPSSWRDRLRMRSQARDLAVALGLVGSSIQPTTGLLSDYGLSVQDFGADTPSALVDGPVEVWQVVSDWFGTTVPDVPGVHWRLLLGHEEVWALLGVPVPALWPWDKLQAYVDELGSRVGLEEARLDPAWFAG